MSVTDRNPRSWALIAISEPGLDVHEITRQTGIRPDLPVPGTVEGISGEPISSPLWQIHSKKDANLPLEEHIWELIERIAPHRKEFKSVCERHRGVLYCSVEYNDGRMEEASLDSKLLLLLGNLGLKIAFQAWRLQERGRRSEDQDNFR
ncbi:DUF4279 domain-containing protein [Leptospira fluminis]|uniref:DUF4279 domain-containing protein n=1 Tax=Leptospira fluminis TaxID=2484979 RepID=A0A4R9GS80_9LEPT|nr:DUF4279 domain-containing protein [Leptospira fluminis]TGK20201.1 DUF4279 domain-containing protein [Leptospira fluminis]